MISVDRADGQDLQSWRRVVAEAPDVREDLVRKLRSQVSSGVYQVSVELLARKLVSREVIRAA